MRVLSVSNGWPMSVMVEPAAAPAAQAARRSMTSGGGRRSHTNAISLISSWIELSCCEDRVHGVL